ncbi:MAG TPA: symmetrical bis(5'-nucleosyl)-tetraphosphatase [Steroidobacteraceae bacterium]|nr:symmetrical bis(5'-nucleosyl)-tetraphosphatase [Steroidobacteraceae bacterium]
MRFAIGDIQGCADELRALVERLGFNADRDQLWFVGDLVNRGPRSLEVLRYVHARRDNASVVLGNHDLHLLALAYGSGTDAKSGDTLDAVLAAPDRDLLLEWLLQQPLAHLERGDLLVHAGLVPQWTATVALELAREVESALQANPAAFFSQMYGDTPDRWSERLVGMERWRFVVNVLTRLRVCTPRGRVDLRMKGPPERTPRGYRPWFELEQRRSAGTRVVFGHWSALGYVNAHGVLGLDTGCVWGGALTAVNLDSDAPPVRLPCSGYQLPDEL